MFKQQKCLNVSSRLTINAYDSHVKDAATKLHLQEIIKVSTKGKEMSSRIVLLFLMFSFGQL